MVCQSPQIDFINICQDTDELACEEIQGEDNDEQELLGNPLDFHSTSFLKQQLSLGEFRNSLAATVSSSHVLENSPEVEMHLDEAWFEDT